MRHGCLIAAAADYVAGVLLLPDCTSSELDIKRDRVGPLSAVGDHDDVDSGSVWRQSHSVPLWTDLAFYTR